ncbi:flagellar basal body L-ring protein FlgH [Candidatus Magnetaquicoccus inordinatus]|uniref:flagellar basal body L-ring protein FlgH n=1 Tax=Candidatus Magnetaquicoccus inordinatus TaxID=2496818 RepID=UPI00102D0C07|nr:flagellar basal body L-ring protein FlgH [Candidatus Magnetaquicoccus inordinatus]
MNGKMGWKVSVLVLLAVTASGCSMTRASARPPAPIAVVQPVPPENMAPRKGSIWQTSDRNTLFLDNKARNIGDIVTVQIVETSNAKKEAKTDLNRSGSNDFGLTGVLSPAGLFGAKLPGATGGALTAGTTSNNTFSGDGKTERNSALKAIVSCVVVEILGNGNLRISGRQDITVNNENQFILISGVIRPEDITPQNSVVSSQMADARIEYSGEGDVNDQQRGSWLSRIFATVN